MTNQYVPRSLRDLKKEPRKNLKKELRLERLRVIDEAITDVRRKMRTVPNKWHIGYHSAITTLELMKDGNKKQDQG